NANYTAAPTQQTTITIVPATAADAAQSTIFVQPGSFVADGTTAATFIVTLKNSQGGLVPNKTVRLAQGTGRSVISPASSTSGTNGQVYFLITDTTAEPVTYTVIDTTDGVTLTQTATITFMPVWVTTPAPGSVLAPGGVPFTWTPVAGATQYRLLIGTSA